MMTWLIALGGTLVLALVIAGWQPKEAFPASVEVVSQLPFAVG